MTHNYRDRGIDSRRAEHASSEHERRPVVEQFRSIVDRIAKDVRPPLLRHLQDLNARTIDKEADVDAAGIVALLEIRLVARLELACLARVPVERGRNKT